MKSSSKAFALPVLVAAVAWLAAAIVIVPPVTPPGSPAAPVSAAGNTYYVATDGDDANVGTPAAPWRTIQRAADLMGPGESAYVRAGTYNEGVTLRNAGAPGTPITFSAYPGETVVLEGGGLINAGFATDFSDPARNISDIAISGFTIRNFRQNGLAAWSTNDRLTLSNLVIEGNGDFGILISNSDGARLLNVLMRNNVGGFSCSPILPPNGPGCTNLRIADTRAIDNGTGGDTGLDAFAVEKGGDILVERSLASGGPGDGFDFKSDRTTLSRVIAYNTRNNIKLWGVGSTLVNSLAYDAKADANLVLVAGGSYTVTNVTIANMAGTAYLAVVGDTSGSGSTPVSIHNSIFYNDNPAMAGTVLWLGPSVSLTGAGNNLYYNPFRTDAVICAEYPPHSGQCYSDADISNHTWVEANSQYANPLFLSASPKDFHLAAGSPAINAGTSGGAPGLDLEGRPRAGAPDVGAYEWSPPLGPRAFFPYAPR